MQKGGGERYLVPLDIHMVWIECGWVEVNVDGDERK